MQKRTNLAKPLRILIINTLYSPNFVGGAERSVQLLAEELKKNGNEVSVVTINEKRSYEDTINGVKVYYLKNKNIYWPYKNKEQSKASKVLWHLIDTYKFLYKEQFDEIIEKEAPNIIHTNNICGFSASIFSYLKEHLSTIPIIHTSRDYYLLCYKNTLFKKGRNCDFLCSDCSFLSKWKMNKINQNVDIFIGISNHILQRHKKAGLSSRIPKKRIFNAVQKENGNYVRNHHDEQLRFGFIGALNEAKGVEFMLKIFNLKRIKNQEWSLKIAGRGSKEYVSYLKKNYGNEKIEFVGFVNSDDFYKSIDALIVPSLWEEPFGRVVIEGLQRGLDVFTTKKGGLKEISYETKGIINFDEENILQYLNKTIRHNAYSNKKLLQQFDNRFITMQYLEVYNEILNQK